MEMVQQPRLKIANLEYFSFNLAPFLLTFTMIFVVPTTLSQDRKLTHDKTLPLGFTKKMEQLNIALKIWCSVDIFETKYNKSNILEHFFWSLHQI